MILFLLILIPALAFGQPRDKFGIVDYSEPNRHALCRHGRIGTLDDSLHQYNTIKIWSDLTVDLDQEHISGSARYLVAVDEAPLPRIDLRLTSGLTIDSTSSLSHTVDSIGRVGEDSLQVYLSPSLQLGDTVDFTLFYQGTPDSIDSWGGMRFAGELSWKPQICYSMGDGLDIHPPPANYNWIPIYSDPNDKTEWEIWLHVPPHLVGVSAGARLDSVLHADSTSTWHYRLDQPVSTYLLFVSVSDYLIMTQRESDPVIENFVYPSRWTQAQTHFTAVPACLDSFAAHFGPFVFDRFGYNMTRKGDMEHVTCVSHRDDLVGSNNAYDWLLFHEMSHMWWGDWVTIADWRDLWLNEGFASYCEALGMEWTRGEPDFRNYVRVDLQVGARNAGSSSTIYDPDYYWGNIVYAKGGCVLHMLRWVLGDSLFFETLRDYGEQYAFANATTAEFQSVCESHYDSTLQWFFDEWVFEGVGYPRYEVLYDISGAPRLTVNQLQSTNKYTMPIELAGYVNDAVILDTIWVIPDQNGEWSTADIADFDSVLLDPNGWILKSAVHRVITSSLEQISLPKSFELKTAYPNPFNPAITLSYDSPVAQEVLFIAYNIRGQLVYEQKVLAHVGSNSLDWDASAQASGIYMLSLNTKNESRTVKAVLLK
ncbi:MAG: T9SS type A sorting domain-containing protein [Calditrichaeota bacterium]|nr:T9SS type A sorting domain-containing protein [Calditrichota bacterium]MCB9368473.1 T9SS type A sorting domain-containing protein [Calditrichota bacterium]